MIKEFSEKDKMIILERILVDNNAFLDTHLQDELVNIKDGDNLSRLNSSVPMGTE